MRRAQWLATAKAAAIAIHTHHHLLPPSLPSQESDPSWPKFKEWLSFLGAGEYTGCFLAAGYDLPFISKVLA
jgi:hypothetical protein